MVAVGWLRLMALCASLKWVLKLGHVLSASGLSCHLQTSLAKMVARLMMIRPMLTSWAGVSAMLACSLIAAEIFTIG